MLVQKRFQSLRFYNNKFFVSKRFNSWFYLSKSFVDFFKRFLKTEKCAVTLAPSIICSFILRHLYFKVSRIAHFCAFLFKVPALCPCEHSFGHQLHSDHTLTFSKGKQEVSLNKDLKFNFCSKQI